MDYKEFSKQLGITASYGNYLKNGQRMPSGDLLIRIILHFELDPLEAMNAYKEGMQEFGQYLRRVIFDVEEKAC